MGGDVKNVWYNIVPAPCVCVHRRGGDVEFGFIIYDDGRRRDDVVREWREESFGRKLDGGTGTRSGRKTKEEERCGMSTGEVGVDSVGIPIKVTRGWSWADMARSLWNKETWDELWDSRERSEGIVLGNPSRFTRGWSGSGTVRSLWNEESWVEVWESPDNCLYIVFILFIKWMSC